MLSVQPIMGVTINTVMIPPAFRLFLYSSALVIVVSATLFFLLNKSSLNVALKKAALVAFFSSGIIYAIHADYVWSSWLAADVNTFGGLSVNEKLVRLEGGLCDFARVANTRIDGDYMLFSSQDYMAYRLEYFLLPKRKRKDAQYIVVLADQQSSYDQSTRIFARGDLAIKQVEMIAAYARNAYVLKRTTP